MQVDSESQHGKLAVSVFLLDPSKKGLKGKVISN